MESGLKRTPLYERHIELGGKVVPFAGWELPVQYSGIIAEHQAVRSRAGLFDVSHMGEIIVSGPESLLALQMMTCNDISVIADGAAQYNAIINPQGGVVDDIIVYRRAPEHYFVCVNAANTAKDFAWFTEHNRRRAQFVNKSAEYGQIALQGPAAESILGKLLPASDVKALRYFHFMERELAGAQLLIARTGYTGEDGFELFVPWAKTAAIWDLILDRGAPEGLIPCGLGARDSLRLEACYPLHGHELGDEISAIESGLGWIVKPAKGEFCGRDVLSRQKAEGAPRSLAGFFVEDAGIARNGDKVFAESGGEIGYVTSGTKTPSVGRALGLALVTRAAAKPGTKIAIEVRGKRLAAQVVERPFYTSAGLKK